MFLGNETLWEALAALHPRIHDDRPYNINWPFPFCASCIDDDDDDDESSDIPPHGRKHRKPAPEAMHTSANATAGPAWAHWSLRRQARYLIRLFPLPGSRLINIVSDECMLKSMLTAYDLVAPEWQSEGGSSHVDWSRADDHGHPGVYSRAAVQLHPSGIRAVRTCARSWL
jgi:hypothetical protein